MADTSVESLESLSHWHQPGTHCAVLGHPVSHSLSPLMHTAALKEMAETHHQLNDWHYHKIDVVPERLGEALNQLHLLGFHGINLTVPHKIQALELINSIDPLALRMGAANTLIRTESGWHGTNTDGYGLEQAVRQAFSRTLAEQPLIIVGAGGAARAAAIWAADRGCQHIWIINRTESSRQQLAHTIQHNCSQCTVETFSPKANLAIPPGSLIVQATSLGLKADDPLPLAADAIPADASVFDMIYNPAQTALLSAAQTRGARTANGLAMLAWQGARSLQMWTQLEVPADTMLAAINAATNLRTTS